MVGDLAREDDVAVKTIRAQSATAVKDHGSGRAALVELSTLCMTIRVIK